MTRVPLLERLADVLGELRPATTLKKRRLLLPLAVLLIAAVDGEAERDLRPARLA